MIKLLDLLNEQENLSSQEIMLQLQSALEILDNVVSQPNIKDVLSSTSLSSLQQGVGNVKRAVKTTDNLDMLDKNPDPYVKKQIDNLRAKLAKNPINPAIQKALDFQLNKLK